MSRTGFFVKRLFDVCSASVALVILSPLFLLLVVMIRFGMGGKAFFRQTRPGLNGRPFEMVKFRTMTEARDETGELLSDDKRLTALGRILRATSLDELPELWNVVKGDMSLVGPRPLLMEYLPLYSKRQFRRHEVRPGITGWAQVNGRNSLDWEQRFELDVWYVDNQSLWLDLKILIMTLVKVVKREGISHDGSATMPNFRGRKNDE